MKTAKKFVVSSNWKTLLDSMEIDASLVLAYAELAADLFVREGATLTPEQYFDLWQAMEKAAGDRELPLLLSKHLSIECFDVPIFASICSPNLNTAIKRLSQYKPLIGPMILNIEVSNAQTELVIECYGYKQDIPRALGLSELVFFTQLSRIATQEKIQPIAAQLPELPENTKPYESYFGCKLQKGKAIKLVFRAEDASRPFLTSNAVMWDFFENDLKQKLSDLDSTASTSERLKSALLEALPSDNYSVESMARKLSMSTRSLQRKLSEEAVSFNYVLQTVREELADHYLKKSEIPLSEISFLLGYNEPNSFIRAFSSWKGVSPGYYREHHC